MDDIPSYPYSGVQSAQPTTTTMTKPAAPRAHLLDEVARRPESHQHAVSITNICQTAVPLRKSFLYHKQDLLMDASCYRNRANRVGWSRHLTFVHALRSAKGWYFQECSKTYIFRKHNIMHINARNTTLSFINDKDAS